jgi:hypothetical protein
MASRGVSRRSRENSIGGSHARTQLAAFKIQQEERGASLNANLPMQVGTATVIPVVEPAPS